MNKRTSRYRVELRGGASMEIEALLPEHARRTAEHITGEHAIMARNLDWRIGMISDNVTVWCGDTYGEIVATSGEHYTKHAMATIELATVDVDNDYECHGCGTVIPQHTNALVYNSSTEHDVPLHMWNDSGHQTGMVICTQHSTPAPRPARKKARPEHDATTEHDATRSLHVRATEHHTSIFCCAACFVATMLKLNNAF